MTCYIIDDDPDDRELFEIALQNSGQPYKLIAVENGKKALEILTKDMNPPDFIFLDLNMPMLSGKECLAAMRDLPNLKNAAIIIYSTSSYKKDIEDTKDLGANYFLSKIADIDRLSEILSDILTKKSLPFVLN
mgnify:FL=1